MASREVDKSWTLFIIIIFVLCLFYYKLYVLLFLYFNTQTFTLPSELLGSISNSLANGDRLNNSIANLFRSLIFVFSAVAYTRKLSLKTLFLVVLLLVSIGIDEFLILKFQGEQVEKYLQLSEIDVKPLIQFLSYVEDSLVTYTLVLLGLGAAKKFVD